MTDWKAEWAAEEADMARRDEWFRQAAVYQAAGALGRKGWRIGLGRAPWHVRARRKLLGITRHGN